MQGRVGQASAVLLGPNRSPRAAALADVCLAAVVLLIGLPSVFGRPAADGEIPQRLLLALALALPLLWRRRFPLAVFAVIAAVAFVQLRLSYQLVGDVALLAAFYTVSARESLLRSVAAAAVLEAGCLMAVLRWAPGHSAIVFFVLLSGMTAAAFLSGTTMRLRRAHLTSLEDRAERLERERDQQAKLATAGERARIAREMHDIVAHNLSVMIALADGASLTVKDDALRAGVAMDQVSSTGRQALTEMRRLLGVLRDDDEVALLPQPGLADLDQLLAQVRLVGLRGELVTEGRPPASLPPGLQLTVYRLVQEALTNVLKHAVGATAAVVRLRFQPDRLDVEVTDDGRPVVRNHELGHELGHDGHGLTGMRERAAVYGGVVEAGPCGVGWQVRSAFMLTPASTS